MRQTVSSSTMCSYISPPLCKGTHSHTVSVSTHSSCPTTGLLPGSQWPCPPQATATPTVQAPGRSRHGHMPVPGRATNTHPPRQGPGRHPLNLACTALRPGRSLSPQRKPTQTRSPCKRQWPGLELFFFSHPCSIKMALMIHLTSARAPPWTRACHPSLTCPASVTARQCRAPTATCTIFFPRSPSTTCGFRTCTSEPWPSLK